MTAATTGKPETAAPAVTTTKSAKPGTRASSKIVVTGLLVVVALYFLVPVYWVVVASTKTTTDLFSTNGFWFAPEREALQQFIDASQETVTGTARLKLYKGNCIVVGRKSPNSLYSEDIASFEKSGGYEQKDATGFIRLNALRLRIAAYLRKKGK